MTEQSSIEKVTPAEGVLFQQLPAGESVLLDMGSEVYFGLDEVGSRMWHALTDGKSADETVAELLDEYDVEPERIRSDTLEFYAKLLEAGLVEPVGNKVG